MQSGWIKFYRKTFDKAIPKDDVSRWTWLICAAEYDGDYRGKLITTTTSLAESWHIGRGVVRGILKRWELDGRIETVKIHNTSVKQSSCTLPSPFTPGANPYPSRWGIEISIINYERYQGGDSDPNLLTDLSSEYSLEKNKKRNISAKNADGEKEKKKKKLGSESPHHQEVVDYFHQEFERRYRKKYVWQTKDFAAIKRLLKKLDAGDLKQRISEYLRDDDPFLVSNGHSVALLQTRINAYGKPHFGDKQTKGAGYLKSVY